MYWRLLCYWTASPRLFWFKLYVWNIHWKTLGISINEKGYLEKGFTDTGAGDWLPYSAIYSRTYIGFFSGLSYDLRISNSLIINIAQVINPEINGDYNSYSVKPISTRTSLSFQYKTSEKITLKATPFFQTALTPYIKEQFNGEYTYWRPFGFGITLGILWWAIFARLFNSQLSTNNYLWRPYERNKKSH